MEFTEMRKAWAYALTRYARAIGVDEDVAESTVQQLMDEYGERRADIGNTTTIMNQIEKVATREKGAP